MLIHSFRELRPDLVALQEPIKTEDYDQVVDLLGTEFHVVHHNEGLVGDGDHNGASIASRWPLGEVREVDLNVTPRTADFPCTTIVAEVLAPEPIGPLVFVNHLPSYQLGFEYERELQTVAAARSWRSSLEGAACTSCWPVTSMPILTLPACASGVDDSPWAA